MAASTTLTQNGQSGDQPKSKPSKTPKQATKDPKRCSWLENSANQLLSGIEFRSAESNELVQFITIQHKEIHKESTPFRITIPVNGDGTFEMPRKQTFEEMIQAKRRQQNALYAASHQTSTSSVLSSRAARRVSAAARRRSQAAPSRSSSHRSIKDERPEPAAPDRSKKSTSRSRPKRKKSSRSSPSKKSKTNNSVAETEPSPTKAGNSSISQPSTSSAPVPSTSSVPSAAIATTINVEKAPSQPSISETVEVKTTNAQDIASMTTTGKPIHLISSIKELARQNPSLGLIDKKEIKRLLKSAPPGAALVLSNGTVIKKSNRGGARAGAGRKRSRPLTNGSQASNVPSNSQQDSRSSLTNMSTSSDQTVLSGTANTSESNTTLNS